MPASPLSYGELLRVSWLIAWRYFAMLQLFSRFLAGMLLFGLVGILSTLGMSRPVIGWIAEAVVFATPFLVFYPLTIGMVLNKEFRGFGVDVIDEGGMVQALRAKEYLILGLSFAVGAYLSVMIAGTIVTRLYPPSLHPPWFALVFAILWHVFVAYPVLLRLLLALRFKGRRFEVIRTEANP